VSIAGSPVSTTAVKLIHSLSGATPMLSKALMEDGQRINMNVPLNVILL